ncbi:probable pectinesterase 66 [Chenopodium quinoa]|uniref:probable pectinesterase 66 n=1 Tax=Chenopodium quinoa TaxID=63459 RepID=UPI000B789D5A|nr:probable pectinesterase 66 [Chenopodium quinoa]
MLCFLLSGATDCQNAFSIAYTITVSQSGGANFITITDALNSIPEQITILPDKGGRIILEGSDRITTLGVSLLRYLVHFARVYSSSFSIGAPEDTERVPAVSLGSFGDKHAFYSCGFVGYQDTLWDGKGRHYFKSCYIEGAADFIFGNGQSVYEQCTINVTGAGWITAQSRPSTDDTTGYVFRNCDVSGTGHADLGRAYNASARVIFIDSKFSEVVNPKGWDIWNQSGHENDVIFVEVNCTGPGADIAKRVSWEKKLDYSTVKQYDTQIFINQDGWIAKQPL